MQNNAQIKNLINRSQPLSRCKTDPQLVIGGTEALGRAVDITKAVEEEETHILMGCNVIETRSLCVIVVHLTPTTIRSTTKSLVAPTRKPTRVRAKATPATRQARRGAASALSITLLAVFYCGTLWKSRNSHHFPSDLGLAAYLVS